MKIGDSVLYTGKSKQGNIRPYLLGKIGKIISLELEIARVYFAEDLDVGEHRYGVFKDHLQVLDSQLYFGFVE